MKIKYLAAYLLVFISISAFAGIEYDAKITSKVDGANQSTVIMKISAQNGNVKEEFIDVKGKDNTGREKGSYFLYKGNSNTVTIVDTEEKTYYELPLDKMMGAIGQIMEIKVSNVKVSVKKLADEKVGGYACSHVMIESSYDMETKIMFMTTQTRVEQSQEIWGTDKIPAADFAGVYKNKAMKTSIKDLDQLIEKQSDAFKNMNLILKTVTTQKSSDKANPKSVQNSTSVMMVEKVAQKKLSDDIFKVPAAYKRTEAPSAAEEEKGGDSEGNEAKPEDFLKGLFGN